MRLRACHPCMNDERAAIKGYASPPPRTSRPLAFAAGAKPTPQQVIDAVLQAQRTSAMRSNPRTSGTFTPWPQSLRRGSSPTRGCGPVAPTSRASLHLPVSNRRGPCVGPGG
jgi:hypothetical protein